VTAPRVSIVLAVRNAAEIVGGTLDSLRAQSFRDFEVVVVDGASTDGTTELLRAAAADLPIELVSEPDRSVSHALSKGLARATGDILGILCADERYYPHTLANAVRWFDEAPDAATFTGRLDFIDAEGIVTDGQPSAAFDPKGILDCALVPSIAATFFNRRLIGAELRYDPEVATCCDYELWARLSFLYPAEAFRRADASVAKAFRTEASMSFRPESFAAFTRDKLAHLETVLARFVPSEHRAAVRNRAAAGIRLWAGEQLYAMDPDHPDILRYCREAAALDPRSPRIARLVAMQGRAAYDPATGTVARTAPDAPGPGAAAVEAEITMTFDKSKPGVRPVASSPLTLRTADSAWDYSYLVRANAPAARIAGQPWMTLDLEVLEGAVGVAQQIGNDLRGERILRPADGRKTVLLPLRRDLPMAVCLRSGGVGGSVLRVHRLGLLVDPA